MTSDRIKQRFFEDDEFLVHHQDGTVDRVDGKPLTEADREYLKLHPLPIEPENKSVAA